MKFPDYISHGEGTGGLPKIVVNTPWSIAEIYLHGAQVTHFQKNGEEPLLFLSELSSFESGKAIRGGIPVIFPWFGPRKGFPAHGYARTREWTLAASTLSSEGVVTLFLTSGGTGELEAELIIHVGQTLALEMIITNLSDQPASFENCLHTYLQIGAIGSISIHGLTGATYLDKVTPGTFTETASALTIACEVDRVYLDTAAAIELHDPKLARIIRIEKSGSNSTVIWNPWSAKSQLLPDLGDAEYLQMFCIESGNIASNQITLAPAAKAVMKVEISTHLL